jgi:hypothetical protein
VLNKLQPMSRRYLQKSDNFFKFLLDSNTSSQQKQFILQNLSKPQLQSIIEILYNLFQNKNIRYSPTLEKLIKQHQSTFNKLFRSKKFLIHRRFIKKHYHLIYSVLYKAKAVISQFINPQ